MALIHEEKLLVRIIGDWGYPDLMRQTPGNLGHWDNILFTLDQINECDYVIVFNYINKNYEVYCSARNIWCIIQEPYQPNFFPWIVEGHEIYNRVYSPFIFPNKNKYIISDPMLPWYIDKSYDELIGMAMPEKKKNISMISSGIAAFPGHINRNKFLDFLIDQELNIDFFGRKIKFIENKWDGLEAYKYSIAIENSTIDNYWTEKISDCFLAYTMPIYYGCKNILQYFPAESMLIIDIDQPETSLKIIKNAVENNHWEKNLNAIIKARDLVLNKYNFFASIASKIKNDNLTQKKEVIILKEYKPSLKYRSRLKIISSVFWLISKISKILPESVKMIYKKASNKP